MSVSPLVFAFQACILPALLPFARMPACLLLFPPKQDWSIAQQAGALLHHGHLPSQ